MVAVQFKSVRIAREWASDEVSPVLKFILRSCGVYKEGVRITCLIRTDEENDAVGGVKNSKHVINRRNPQCTAVDVNPPWSLEKSKWEKWRHDLADYIMTHLRGVQVIIHGEGDNRHAHIEIDLLSCLCPTVQFRENI